MKHLEWSSRFWMEAPFHDEGNWEMNGDDHPPLVGTKYTLKGRAHLKRSLREPAWNRSLDVVLSNGVQQSRPKHGSFSSSPLVFLHVRDLDCDSVEPSDRPLALQIVSKKHEDEDRYLTCKKAARSARKSLSGGSPGDQYRLLMRSSCGNGSSFHLLG